MVDAQNTIEERLVRAYRLLSRCNEAVVQATDETQLMQEICRLLVDAGGYRMAWIGSAGKDPAKRVRPVVSAGTEQGYLDTIDITWDDSERGKGPTGTAIRTGRPVICQNMLTDPSYALWREQATRQGYASSIALPLLRGKTAYSALNVYATEPDAFGPKEVELLTSLANNLTHGIISLWSSKALRESEARLSAVLEQLPVGVGVLDRDGRIILSNSALQLFAPQKTMPSRDPEQRGRWKAFDSQGRSVPPEQWPGERALRGEKVTPGVEFLHTGEDGRRLWTLVSSVPFLSEDDDIIGAITVAKNITDRKQMELSLKDHQEKLSEKLRELQRSNEELSEYAYIISHDLKAPLRAVRNYADFLAEDLEGRLSEEHRSYLSGIKKATTQGLELILDLLTFSRIGESLEEPEKIDLDELVRDIRETLMVPEDMKLSVRSGCPHLVAERTLVKQILLNLVANAIKFNDAAVKEVEIGCRRNLENQIEVMVRDNGIGIEKRYFDQIFRVFQRLHPASAYEGTGIGLAIVKKAAAALGGSVRVESTPGKGSTFILALPNIAARNRP